MRSVALATKWLLYPNEGHTQCSEGTRNPSPPAVRQCATAKGVCNFLVLSGVRSPSGKKKLIDSKLEKTNYNSSAIGNHECPVFYSFFSFYSTTITLTKQKHVYRGDTAGVHCSCAWLAAAAHAPLSLGKGLWVTEC